MNPSLHLRLFRLDDLPFADSLRSLVGWNQTLDDWRRFLAMEPDGCFLAEWNGAPVGTATTLRYGSEVAWIGMVLVHPEFRRRGIGRALLNHCIDWLRKTGVRCIKLDATPAGKQVYDGMGFKDEWTLSRWEHQGVRIAQPAYAGLLPWRDAEWAKVGPLDMAAFGAARDQLFASLAPQSLRAFLLEPPHGPLLGYGLIRAGSRANYLGPIAARSAEAGIMLVEALLAARPGERVFWDIPDANTPAADWARENGFTQQRMLTRMYLGNNPARSNPRMQFALAGPEVG